MAGHILQFSEQDSDHERARKLNDLAKLLDNRTRKNETDIKDHEERIDNLED